MWDKREAGSDLTDGLRVILRQVFGTKEFPRWVALDDAHYNLLRRRLLSCNNRLRLYRSKLVSGMSPRCFCHDDVNESLAHFLWDCPMHEARRKQLLLSMQRLGGMAVGGVEGDGGSEEGGEVVGGEVVVEDVLLGREREGSVRQGWDDMSPVDQSRLLCKLFQGKSRFRSNFRLAALLGVTALRPPPKLDVLFGSYVSECWSAREGKREELGVEDGGEEVIDLTEVPSASVPPSPPSDVDVARRGRPRRVDVLARERGSGAQRSVSEFFSSANTLASSSSCTSQPPSAPAVAVAAMSVWCSDNALGSADPGDPMEAHVQDLDLML
eukprot:g44411.t1